MLSCGSTWKNHAPAVAAVAAVRAASGAVLFAQEADTALAAVTRLDKNPNLINKAHTTKKAPCGASQKRGVSEQEALSRRSDGIRRWLDRIHADPFSVSFHPFETDRAVNLGKNRIIPPHADVYARINAGAELTDNDIASLGVLAAKEFHTTPLARTVASIPT